MRKALQCAKSPKGRYMLQQVPSPVVSKTRARSAPRCKWQCTPSAHGSVVSGWWLFGQRTAATLAGPAVVRHDLHINKRRQCPHLDTARQRQYMRTWTDSIHASSICFVLNTGQAPFHTNMFFSAVRRTCKSRLPGPERSSVICFKS